MADDILFRAVGEIDDALLLETEAFLNQGAQERKTLRWGRWAAAAACLAVIAAAGAFLWQDRETPDAAGSIPNAPAAPSAAVSTPPTGLSAPVSAVFNDVPGAPTEEAAMIALLTEDFAAMSYEEVLDYFGAELPVTQALPELTLTGGGCFGDGFGVFHTGERGTYFDVNWFRFEDPSGEKRLEISLRTTFIVDPGVQDIADGPEKIEFTRVMGRDLALFRYTGDGYDGDSGQVYSHTQFCQGGAAWSVTAAGLTDGELVRVLSALLEEKSPAEGPTTVAGTVTHVDGRYGDFFDGQEHHYTESHDFIVVETDGGERLTVWLPGGADAWKEGERVEVTYTGEPATVRNIWPGQLEGVRPAG